MSNSPAYSTLIIGAGAAGLAAGRALHDAGQDILILEARDRIGGRIWTDEHFAEFPIELGAEFIHGEGAATHELLRKAGLDTIPVVRMDKLRWGDHGLAAVPCGDLPEPSRTMIDTMLTQYAEIPTRMTDKDMSLAAYFKVHGWQGEALDAADVLFAQTCCAPLDSLSCADLTREAQVDRAGKDEFRIRQGYKALLDSYSRDLPIRLDTPVSAILRDERGVMVMAGGETIQARRCIITLPVSLLQHGDIHFDPPLSAEKRKAIAAFRMEAATKLIYRFSEPLWDSELTFMAHTGTTARWWTPGYGRDGAAVICAYITSKRAKQIDAMEESIALDTGLRELCTLLDVQPSAARAGLLASRRVSWAKDPFTKGGYAHVPTGAANARPILAQPEGDTLFFAGEATAYDSNPQTVHGALESGWRAAREVLSSKS